MFVLAVLRIDPGQGTWVENAVGWFSQINTLSEIGSKFIKMSTEANLLSGLLNSVRWMARGRGRIWGCQVNWKEGLGISIGSL